MRIESCYRLTLLLLVVLFPIVARSQDAATYAVGVAKVDVTPDYPIRLNGFGVRRCLLYTSPSPRD